MSGKKTRKAMQDDHLFISVDLSEKMEGITGVTTSCTNVDFCQKMRKFAEEHPEEAAEYVCSHCYAEKSSKRGWQCWDHYENNTRLLKEHITRSGLPNLRYKNAGTNFARFNSHGEAPNEECVANFYRIARRNPDFRFALWTKRWYFLVNLAQAGMMPPRNLCIVLSSPKLGEDIDPEIIRTCEEAGVHVDTVFTVYRKEDAEARGIEINCGDRKCAQCRKCYRHHAKTAYIKEELK